MEGLGRVWRCMESHLREADFMAGLPGSPSQCSGCQGHASICYELGISTVLTCRARVGIKRVKYMEHLVPEQSDIKY